MFIWFILYVFIENFDFESEFLGSKSDLEMGAILGGSSREGFYWKTETDFIYRNGIFFEDLLCRNQQN